MAKETIISIRKAERNAEEIIKKAASEKDGLLESAKAEGKKFADELIGKAEAKAKEELAAVEATRAGALEAAQEKAEKIIADFTKAAEEKRDAAIQLVIDEIA